MAPRQEVNEIVQSFVDNDLASLDRIGGESQTFSLSPHLVQEPTDETSAQSAGTTSKTGPPINKPATGSEPIGSQVDSSQERDSTAATRKSSTTSSTTPAYPSLSEAGRGPTSENRTRIASTSSEASYSTIEREKRSSLGDKFKKFGKRIASGSKK